MEARVAFPTRKVYYFIVLLLLLLLLIFRKEERQSFPVLQELTCQFLAFMDKQIFLSSRCRSIN